MQRCRIARTPQTDGRANEQREDADRGQHEVERTGTARNRRDPQVDHFPGAEPQDRVARALAGLGATQHLLDVRDLLYGPVVDRQQEIATADTDRGGRSARRDVGSYDSFRLRRPEDAIFDRMPRCARGDIRDAQAQQVLGNRIAE